MLRLKDAIDEKTLGIIHSMFMQFLHSSIVLYEKDGTYVYSIFEGQYCSYLNNVSCKNAGCCKEEALLSGKWICHEDCLRISRESIDKMILIERECTGGINIFAVPIIYNNEVIGSINAAISNPPLDRTKLEVISGFFKVDADDLMQYAYSCKRLTRDEMEIAHMQIRAAALLISSLYETKLKQIEAEAEARWQNEQLQSIIDSMSDALFVFDKEAKYILRNKAALNHKITANHTKFEESLPVVKCLDLDGNEIPYSDFPVNRILNGETLQEHTLAVQFPDSIRYFSINGVPLYNEDGTFRLGVLCMGDITSHMMREEKLKQQQELILKAERYEKQILENNMRMKDEFLTTITHEFKTHLTVINAAVQAINSLYESQIPESVRKHIQRIRVNSFRQLRLVNNLLDITRFNAGHIKLVRQNLDMVKLSRAIIDSVSIYAQQKEVDLHFFSNSECIVAAIDDEKYERILLNLLSNAIKFTPKGKSIYVNLLYKNKKIIITVKDEGVGIPENKQELIFERFGQVDSSFTRQAEGTGIGLSLVKALVSVLDGTIILESKVGVGSCFTVTLPVTKVRNSSMPHYKLQQQANSKIMQAVEVEFSDIYSR